MKTQTHTSFPRNSVRLLPRSLFTRGGAALAAAGVLVATTLPVGAQSDNFDSYSNTAGLTAAGWILSSLNPALVTTTFPAVGSGKGLRIQAVPVPNTAPAVGMWYRTNEYTDFVVAVDIANWPGTDKNQAMVMFARMTDAGTGVVEKNQNPGTAQGLICNYDSSQYGENPTDRRQGQFQINLVGAGFKTTTLAVAEVTFVPGRPYRMIFKGVGQHFIAQAYDWNDLTTPIVTIEADDPASTYASGACGLLSFSRQSTTGTADATYDNYYAGPADPNPAVAPALAHPVPGTPAVSTRIPAERWKNFLNPATSISFTASTYTTNIINAAATRIRVNGVDLSARLTVSANGTNISGSLPATVLDNNKLYSGEIVVTDLSGTRSSTNTFWFDTFSDTYLLSAKVKTIESEEYNYDAGYYQLDPIPVSGIDTNYGSVNGGGVGYYDLAGSPGVDFTNHTSSPDSGIPVLSRFRTIDPVRTISGGLLGIRDANHPTEYDPGSDNIRSQHAASNLLEYVVFRTEPTEWLNYTRSYVPAFYAAYLRYSSFGATTNELHRVTSDITIPDQTAEKLGNFLIPNNMRYVNYLYTPLVDDAGQAVLLNLTGTNTLRLLMTGTVGQDARKTMLNYIMLVQTPVTVYSCDTLNGTYAQETGATVDVVTRTITVPRSSGTRFYRLGAAVPVTIKNFKVTANTVTLSL